MINQTLSRRTFLKGLGTAMALPLLDAMVPAGAFAKAAAKARPNRMAFVFIPNGAHMQDWTPTAEGPAFELPYILEPLRNVKNELTVLSGLTQDKARPNGDGPGDHARSTAAWLTGCQPRKTAGADIKCGISVDQYAAQHVGNLTRFGSLEIGCERGLLAGNCDSGYSCAYSSAISWHSESTPVPKEVDPRAVFERLFAGGDAADTAENRARRDLYKKSIIDFVLEDANALRNKLGAHDQRKLDEYFTGVREIEDRLVRAEKDPGKSVTGARPSGIPASYEEHLKLMCDMLALAFQADLTRICTFMFANDGSNRPYQFLNIPEGHHDLSHHGGNREKQMKIRDINKFHIRMLAYLLEKLKATPEGEGTILDNSMIVYGAGIGDGNRHNHDDLPILLAGRGAGTIKSGQHLTFPRNTPMNNLFLSMLDRMSVRTDHLGDANGRLEHLI